MKYDVIVEKCDPVTSEGTINGKWWRRKWYGGTKGPSRGMFKPDSLTKGERIAIGRAANRAESIYFDTAPE